VPVHDQSSSPSFSNQTIGAAAENVARLKSADFHNSRWNAAAVLA